VLTPTERDRFIADCVDMAVKLGVNPVGRSLVASLAPAVLADMRRRGWDVVNLNRPDPLGEALNSGNGSYKP
jgi:hypothetical protein